jgi:hypothetical protein
VNSQMKLCMRSRWQRSGTFAERGLSLLLSRSSTESGRIQVFTINISSCMAPNGRMANGKCGNRTADHA